MAWLTWPPHWDLCVFGGLFSVPSSQEAQPWHWAGFQTGLLAVGTAQPLSPAGPGVPLFHTGPHCPGPRGPGGQALTPHSLGNWVSSARLFYPSPVELCLSVSAGFKENLKAPLFIYTFLNSLFLFSQTLAGNLSSWAQGKSDHWHRFQPMLLAQDYFYFYFVSCFC